MPSELSISSKEYKILNKTIIQLITNFESQRLKCLLSGYYTFNDNDIIIYTENVNFDIEKQQKPIDISKIKENDNPIIYLIEYYTQVKKEKEKRQDKSVVRNTESKLILKDKVLEVMEILLQHASDLNFDSSGQIPLFLTFLYNQIDVLKLFLRYFLPSSSSSSPLPPGKERKDVDISQSSTSCIPNVSIIPSLVSKIPLNLHLYNEEWDDLLLYTFKRQNDLPEPSFSFLLNYGFLNGYQEKGEEGSISEATLLNFNAQSWNGKTLIMMAVERQNYEFLKKFFEKLQELHHSMILQILHRTHHHFYQNIIKERNIKLYHHTVKKDIVTVLRSDYRQYLDLEKQDMTQNTALIQSIWTGHCGIVKCLLYHGANPNALDFNGYTPLMIASLLGKYDIVKLLLDYGAEINISTPSIPKETALSLARKNHHYKVVQLLEKYITI